jgi:hypothetical protein
MIGKAMVVVNAFGAAAIAVAFFLAYSDHSWSSALHWAIFYAVGVGIPSLWSYRTARALRDLDIPLSRELRMAPLYPILAGLMTTAIAIGLIREAFLTN